MDDQLPQELVDHIIDHLHDDKHSLTSLSIVSKSWLPPCRLHLFNSICIKRKWSEPFEDFADFVDSTPGVCTYVKNLRLKGQFRTTVLLRILTCLSQLRSLKLQGEFLQVEPTVVPFPPRRLDLLLIELIYSKNYPERTVDVIENQSESSESGDEDDDDDDDWNEDDEGSGSERGSDDGSGGTEEAISEDDESAEDDGGPEDEDGEEDENGSEEDNVDEEDDEEQEDGDQTDGYDSNYDEVDRLISVLRLFYEVRELIVAYPSEHPSWRLTPNKLLALVPEPTMLKAETFRLYHEELHNSVFSFFRRYLHLPSIRTLMVKVDYYPTGKIFRDLLLEAPSLTDLNVCANGFGKWFLYTQNAALTRCIPQHTTLLIPLASRHVPPFAP